MEIKAVCEVTSVFPAAGCVCNVCVRSERGGLLRRTGASLSLSPPTLPCPALLFSARTTSSSSSSLCRSTHLYRISGVYYTPRAHLSGLFLPRRTFLPLKEEAHRCKPEVPASQPQESVCVCVCVCVFPILCVCVARAGPGVCLQRRSSHVRGGEEAVLCGLSLRGR